MLASAAFSCSLFSVTSPSFSERQARLEEHLFLTGLPAFNCKIFCKNVFSLCCDKVSFFLFHKRSIISLSLCFQLSQCAHFEGLLKVAGWRNQQSYQVGWEMTPDMFLTFPSADTHKDTFQVRMKVLRRLDSFIFDFLYCYTLNLHVV